MKEQIRKKPKSCLDVHKMKIFYTLLVIVFRCFHFATAENDVQIPPSITEGPLAHLIFWPGSVLHLVCKAEGSPDAKYTWTKNDVALKDHTMSNVPQLFKLNAQPDDQGIYQCTATNPYGTDISDKSHVQMGRFEEGFHLGLVIEQVFATEGQPLIILAPQLETVPKADFYWLLEIPGNNTTSYRPLQPSKRIQLDESGNMYFAYVVPEDELVTYLPVFRYETRYFVGNYTKITVTKAGESPIREQPILRYHNGPSAALLGRNLTLRCIYSGYPDPVIEWTVPNYPLPARHELKLNDTQLYIAYVQWSDQGSYTCGAWNPVNKTKHAFHIINVEVVPFFNRTVDRPHNIDALEGSDATFVCNPTAKPEASIKWFRNGESIDVSKLPTRFEISKDNKSLTIKFVSRQCSDRTSKTDLMVIQCNASNVHGYAFASGYLNVIAPPGCEGGNRVAWWVVLASTLSFGALMLCAGLGVGVRCKSIDKNRPDNIGHHVERRTRCTPDSYYDVIPDEAMALQRVDSSVSPPIPTGQQTPQSHTYVPEGCQGQDREPHVKSQAADYTPLQSPHYLVIRD